MKRFIFVVWIVVVSFVIPSEPKAQRMYVHNSTNDIRTSHKEDLDRNGELVPYHIKEGNGGRDYFPPFTTHLDSIDISTLPDTFYVKIYLPPGLRIASFYQLGGNPKGYTRTESLTKGSANTNKAEVWFHRHKGRKDWYRINRYFDRDMFGFRLYPITTELPKEAKLYLVLYHGQTNKPLIRSHNVSFVRYWKPYIWTDPPDSTFYFKGQNSFEVKFYGKHLRKVTSSHIYLDNFENFKPEWNILKIETSIFPNIGYYFNTKDIILEGGMFEQGAVFYERTGNDRDFNFIRFDAMPDSGLIFTLRIRFSRYTDEKDCRPQGCFSYLSMSGLFKTSIATYIFKGKDASEERRVYDSVGFGLTRDGVFQYPTQFLLTSALKPEQISLRADLNKDGKVDFQDFLLLTSYYNSHSLEGDIDGDGYVGFSDFLILTEEFAKSQ